MAWTQSAWRFSVVRDGARQGDGRVGATSGWRRGNGGGLWGDGTRAVTYAGSNPPDLIILDLGLPDMDGNEVVQGLRGWTRVPIIILSARDTQPDKVGSLDAGADDSLSKPFGMDTLLSTTRADLRRAQPRAAAHVIHNAHDPRPHAANTCTPARTGVARHTPK